MREMDLVLGRFADAQIGDLSDAELDEFERWLEVPDQQIFAWVNGAASRRRPTSTPRCSAACATSIARADAT